jgi:hypothetical protein
MDNRSDSYDPSLSDLMVNESREALFQLESAATSLDNKGYGIVAFDTIILSILAYFLETYPNKLLYICGPSLSLVISLFFVFFSIYPRTTHRMSAGDIINLYGQMKFEDAAGTLALNYASLDKELKEIYENKYKHLRYSLTFTMLAISVGMLTLAYLIFGSLNLSAPLS